MSFEKIVKLACKPKAAPPKAKYLDPIIAATYSDDGAIGDVCRALSGRLREPNATVVFKALIVLHTMIRTGNTDNVLGYLSASDILRLQNVAGSHWEGYSAPENLGQYARYLQIRIKTFRELKHDPVRVQSDSNRDHRVGNFDNDRDFGGGNGAGVSRSKTIVGRKLRVMSVEKGLLRETRLVQAVVDALTGTKFYVDNLEEELNVVALRMLVKDLLILFQAVNEGIINLLEHYFEMSHVDAKEALDLYRRFCRQTEAVVEYLSIAKKLQNLLNVSIPNLKHAPVSLVKSLEEYLNDPNFEDNRLEYKANKAAADGKAAPRQKGILKTPSSPSTPAPPEKPSSSSTPTTSAPSKAQNVADFFASIEQEQGTIFNPNTGSPTSNYFQQQAAINPFALQQAGGLLPQQTGALAFQQPQVTGFPGQPAGGAFLAPQTTGFPQASAASAFFAQAQAQPQPQPQLAGLGQAAFLAPQPQQSSGFLQPQPTGFLQPQTTGSNPFRQSMLMPQATGLPAFGAAVASTSPAPMSNFNPFPRPSSAAGLLGGQSRSTTLPPLQEVPMGFDSATGAFGGAFSPTPQLPQQPTSGPFAGLAGSSIPRPASTPIKSDPVPSFPGGVATHTTGGKPSRNPFGAPAPPPPPPVPKAPTLLELASGTWQSPSSSTPANGTNGFGGISNGSGHSTPLRPTSPGGDGGFRPVLTAQPTGNGLIGSIASSFATGAGSGSGSGGSTPPGGAGAGSSTSPFASFLSQNQTGATMSTMTGSGTTPSFSLSSQPTGTSAWSSAFSTSTAPSSISGLGGSSSTPSPLTAQPTGFGGSSVKPFKPSSSFGASIVDKLPPIPSEPTTPGTTGLTSSGTPPVPSLNFAGLSLGSSPSPASTTPPASGFNPSAGQNQPSLLGGLGTQPTGLGGLTPFSSSLGSGLGGGAPSGLQPLQSQATGMANPFRASMAFGGSAPSPPPGTGAGASAFGGLGGLGSSAFGTGANGGNSNLSAFTPSANVGAGAGAGNGAVLPSFTGFGAFSSSFGNSFTPNPSVGGTQPQQQQQQQQQSLI